MKPATPLLQVKELSISFDDPPVKAVNNISFSLDRGQTLGIVGESGSGKSITSLSLLRLIAETGLVEAFQMDLYNREGNYTDLLHISGRDMQSVRGKKIGMIFQEPMTSLNPVIRCGEQVAEAIRLHLGYTRSQAKEKTISLFRDVELPRPEKIYSSYPHELSGGQKQRVMIAMAISCEPELLIADEPTTALDVTVQKKVLLLLKKIQREQGMGLIFITHDLGVVAEIADRIAVMYKGEIVEEGNVSDVFTRPQHPYTKGLLACRPPLDVRLRRLPVVADFLHTDKEQGVKSVEGSLTVSTSERKQNHLQLFSQKPLLQVQNVSKWYSVRKGVFNRETEYIKAVDDVSFDVFPGETLGLVGESGCGKTTLGRTILRLIPATKGKVIFNGQNIYDLDEREMRLLRKEMQIIFQDPYSSLNPRQPIGQALIEPMEVHHLHSSKSERREFAISLLEKVGLKADHFHRYPHQFSGGQRQRICIARALTLNPRFIICDESVSALDVSVQAQVLNLLNDLKREYGFTYIFISHDLSVVKFMSDRMVVMNKGKIEEMGEADEIYTNPKKEYTQRLISAIPRVEI